MPRKTSHALFIEALAELEQIIEDLEADNEDLIESLSGFEPEITLPRPCEPALPSTMQQLQELMPQDDTQNLEFFTDEQ